MTLHSIYRLVSAYKDRLLQVGEFKDTKFRNLLITKYGNVTFVNFVKEILPRTHGPESVICRYVQSFNISHNSTPGF